ncbi:hypothetical protein JYT87_00135 [Nitrospira defluvii]|nr:hypothetical protein [Nitrospira defluvii]
MLNLKKNIFPVILSVCIGFARLMVTPAYSVEPIREDTQNSETFRGLVQRVSFDTITVKGQNFQIASDVVFENAQGKSVSSRLDDLIPHTSVALTIIDRVVVKIRVFGLIRH